MLCAMHQMPDDHPLNHHDRERALSSKPQKLPPCLVTNQYIMHSVQSRWILPDESAPPKPYHPSIPPAKTSVPSRSAGECIASEPMAWRRPGSAPAATWGGTGSCTRLRTHSAPRHAPVAVLRESDRYERSPVTARSSMNARSPHEGARGGITSSSRRSRVRAWWVRLGSDARGSIVANVNVHCVLPYRDRAAALRRRAAHSGDRSCASCPSSVQLLT
ncbi:hypothetical protein C8Q73DRAFT_368336 [Cubamyces lactineus]|nr:hypothetical protein C8Q73DRAFT_368336 [Cubamyces lactineus]